jgi:acetate---CoA ligase (ADP-forming)
MKKFFYPGSVAVVGVSENPFNLGQGIINNLSKFGFQGPIFPIGPKGGRIQGLKILPSLLELPEPVDLVTILAPAPVIPALLDDCGQLGIKRIIVESAGFSEYSDTGRSLENEVRARISQYGLRLIGPNGLGVINQEIGLALPFASIPHRPALGNVSLVCQSGGVGGNLISWLAQTGLGLNKFISLGNKLNVQENEILDYLLEDAGTHII